MFERSGRTILKKGGGHARARAYEGIQKGKRFSETVAKGMGVELYRRATDKGNARTGIRKNGNRRVCRTRASTTFALHI